MPPWEPSWTTASSASSDDHLDYTIGETYIFPYLTHYTETLTTMKYMLQTYLHNIVMK